MQAARHRARTCLLGGGGESGAGIDGQAIRSPASGPPSHCAGKSLKRGKVFPTGFSIPRRSGEESGARVRKAEQNFAKARERLYPTNMLTLPVHSDGSLPWGSPLGSCATFLLERLCLDPTVALNSETLWYFPQLAETLAELHDIRATAAEIAAPMTAIGAKVSEALDYALGERGLVFVDGKSRTGKTFAVKTWCDAHPGQARYVQVPSSNDDISFFRALGDALGIGTSRAYKALELRGKIEAVLHGGDLLLVLDEGHYLIPQRNTRLAVPHRVNWVLTQLVNMGVPVAVVTTPQFTKSQETIVRAGGWSSEQLIGRISPTTNFCPIYSARKTWKRLRATGCQVAKRKPSAPSSPTRKALKSISRASNHSCAGPAISRRKTIAQSPLSRTWLPPSKRASCLPIMRWPPRSPGRVPYRRAGLRARPLHPP